MELSPVIWNIVLTAVIVLMVRAPHPKRIPTISHALPGLHMLRSSSHHTVALACAVERPSTFQATARWCAWTVRISSPTRTHPLQTPRQQQWLPTPIMASRDMLASSPTWYTRSQPTHMLGWYAAQLHPHTASTCPAHSPPLAFQTIRAPSTWSRALCTLTASVPFARTRVLWGK